MNHLNPTNPFLAKSPKAIAASLTTFKTPLHTVSTKFVVQQTQAAPF